MVLDADALRHEQSRLCRHQLDGPGSQRLVCGMVTEALHHHGRDLLYELEFLDQWRRDRGTKYFDQRRVERLKFGTAFSFSDGADELMEASHHFPRRAGRHKTNLTGFLIGNGTSTQPFFIDDLRLIAAPK